MYFIISFAWALYLCLPPNKASGKFQVKDQLGCRKIGEDYCYIPGEGIGYPLQHSWISLVAQMVKNLQCGRPRFNPWVGKIPWRKERLPLQHSCLENPHGQRSLAGYSPRGHKELDTTEWLSTAHHSYLGFPGGSGSKESACNARDPDSIPGLRRSPGGGHDNPLQYSCLENPHGQRSLAV